MKKTKFFKSAIVALGISISGNAISQTLTTAWERMVYPGAITGTPNVVMASDSKAGIMVKTTDGGYIVGYSAYPGTGVDKTSYGYSSFDYWIVKFNSQGVKQWDKTYGGSGWDRLVSIVSTSDGNILLGGWSNSPADGNKTQTNTGRHSWIVKINQSGNIIWDRAIAYNPNGTFPNDHSLTSMIEATNQRIVFTSNATVTYSGTTYTMGRVTMLDSAGTIITYTDAHNNGFGITSVVKQATDGGFIVGGSASNGIQAGRLGSFHPGQAGRGGKDFYVFKYNVNFSGINWGFVYGGNQDDELTSINVNSDGTYILSGNSLSNLSGDKTSANKGGNDFWAVKINSNGLKIWDKDFGTGGSELTNVAIGTSDGNILIAGYSSTPGSNGDKTQNNDARGGNDYWLVKVNNVTGNKIWDRVVSTGLGTSNIEYETPASIIEEPAGFIISGYSFANLIPNFHGNIVKLCNVVQAGFSVSNTNVCINKPIQFTNLSAGAVSYEWKVNNVLFSTLQNPSLIPFTTGASTITLIAKNASGCTSSTSKVINVFNNHPTLSLEARQLFGINDSLIIYAITTPSYGLSTIWSTGSTNSNGIFTNSTGPYSATVTNSNGCSASNSIIAVVPPPATCESKGLNTMYEYIQGVNLLTYSPSLNSITGNNNGYLDATKTLPVKYANLYANQVYSIVLTPGYPSYNWNENWRVWIDYNRDGDFLDAGELVAAAANNTTVVTAIWVPSSMTRGSTKMRVAMKYGSAPSPCETFQDGEVEDYLVNLIPSGNASKSGLHIIDENDPSITINEAERFSVNVFPNPSKGLINLELGKGFNDNAAISVYNVVGELVISNTKNNQVNLSNQPTGVYFIKVSDGIFEVNKKVVIEK